MVGIVDTVANKIQSGFDAVNEFVTPNLQNLEPGIRKAQQFAENITSSKGFMKESRKKSLPDGVMGPVKSAAVGSFPKAQEQDWRVRLSIPNVEPFKSESNLLAPLRGTNGLVFPFTPTVLVSHSASYNALAPTHSNYPYQIYTNSQVDQLVITGDFFVQNGLEAQYWVSALHYLRSCTKMFYGGFDNNTMGAPPPVVKLNGYGDYVFNDVPVVIVQFTIDMPQEVDYISTSIGEYTGGINAGLGKMINEQSKFAGAGGNPASTKSSWAPTQSLFSVTVQPLYSRRAIESFSLDKFVKGAYVGQNTGGFI